MDFLKNLMRNNSKKNQSENLTNYSNSSEMGTDAKHTNKEKGFNILDNPPTQDTRLMEYIGRNVESILEEFPQAKKGPMNAEKTYPLNITLTIPAGELLFIFDNSGICSDAIFFSNEE